MFAVQIRVLIAFTLIVMLVLVLATQAVPAVAADSSASAVTVSVRIAPRVALTLPLDGSDVNISDLTRSNVECEAFSEWVERGGQRVLLLTVVPVS